jgi:hypothetical protein
LLLNNSQWNELEAYGLDGLYLFKFEYIGNGSDSTISHLSINQKQVVFNKGAFPLEEFEFYGEGDFKFRTHHTNALQNIEINEDLLNVSSISTNYQVASGSVYGKIPLGDIIMESTDVFSIPGNYFDMYKYDFVENDADFVLINYISEGENMVTSTIKLDNNGLFYNDKISLILNARHLDRNETINMTVPVDWIEVEYD